MNCNKEPEYLSKGDSIGLISTARKISLKEIEYAIEILQKWSLNVVTSKNLFRQNNQFSGTDEERAHDLQDMINNKNIKEKHILAKEFLSQGQIEKAWQILL